MDSFKVFFEDKLPDRNEFFSSLKNESISEKDYIHAINVWNTFKMNTMSDYHDLYLKTEVFLLADAFEKFIYKCLQYYRFDPCHYFSSPGLSWIHLFIEKGMGRDISYMVKDIVKQIINTCKYMMLMN